jgi:hypothetical protein
MHCLAWAKGASMACITQIHRTKLQRQFHELAQLFKRALLVAALAGDRKYHKIVAKTLGIAETV